MRFGFWTQSDNSTDAGYLHQLPIQAGLKSIGPFGSRDGFSLRLKKADYCIATSKT